MRTAWLALVAVLIGGALVTAITARLLADTEAKHQQATLDGVSEQAAGVMLGRYARHEAQLRAAQALFAGSLNVSREEWRAFTATFLEPGQDATLFELAWVPRVDQDGLERLASAARADGLDDFRLYPPLLREFYCPIFYNEPFEQHATSIGRDVCVSPSTRAAMERSRDSGKVMLSNPVNLGTLDGALHSGYVLFAWVDGGEQQPPGWVAGTITMSQLFGVSLPSQSATGLRVTDSSTPDDPGIVFGKGALPGPEVGLIESQRSLTLGGRSFQLYLSRPASAGLAAQLLIVTGGLITVLLAGLAFTLLRTRARALHAAERMTRAYHDSEELLSSITGNIQEGIYRGEPDKGLIYINQALVRMFGFESRDAFLAYDLTSLYADVDQRDALLRLLEEQGYYRHQEVEFLRPDGSRFTAVNSATATMDEAGRIRHFDGVITDITERKEAERQVHRLAHYDTLTNLPNRTLFHIRIGQVLSQAKRHDRPVAVMFIDLDRFKLVNDSLGHGIGDQLLVAVARRLTDHFRDYDVISRQGGDEFLLVLPETGANRAARRAEELLRDFAENPFSVEGHELTITPSIGIAMFPHDAGEADTLIQYADAAMYHAKEQGRATFRFFTEELNTRVHHRLRMENHLRGALANEELSLDFQPVVDLAEGRISGVEALLRWNSPTLGRVPPSDFIPVAEQSGLIVEIGNWVIEAACGQLARWRERGMRDILMAVNVSAMQLWRGDLVNTVSAALSRFDIEPSRLIIELTESIIMEDLAAARVVLTDLKTLGVALAIDDFGTGYSSLGYLKQFRIDLLKIDRSFIHDVADDADDDAIVTAVLSISEDLRMQAVAEGIERVDQLEFLRARGCRYGQGFLFSPPVGPQHIPELVDTFKLGHSPGRTASGGRSGH